MIRLGQFVAFIIVVVIWSSITYYMYVVHMFWVLGFYHEGVDSTVPNDTRMISARKKKNELRIGKTI